VPSAVMLCVPRARPPRKPGILRAQLYARSCRRRAKSARFVAFAQDEASFSWLLFDRVELRRRTMSQLHEVGALSAAAPPGEPTSDSCVCVAVRMTERKTAVLRTYFYAGRHFPFTNSTMTPSPKLTTKNMTRLPTLPPTPHQVCACPTGTTKKERTQFVRTEVLIALTRCKRGFLRT